MNHSYEEDRINDTSGDAAQKWTAQPNGEYRYIRPDEPFRPYEDAEYIPEKEAPVTPRQYRGSFSVQEEETEKKPAKNKKSILIVAAACVACLIFGAAIGQGVGDSGGENPQGADTQSMQDAQEDPLTSVQTTNTASAISANQIYTGACKQAVGISSEITTRNVFGQTVSGSTSGSGFVVSSDGYILTNYHVIKDAYLGGYEIKVMFYNGDTYTANVVGTEEDNDIAVLKIDADGLSAAELGDSDSMLVGETVYAVGNPLGELSYTMTDGIISALDREIATDDSTIINMFQHSAAVNSGNSGGPVYNSQGQVIGITTAKYGDVGVEGLGFAIPINDAIEIANELIQNGYVSGKPYMGLNAYNVSDSAIYYYNMVAGAFVASVEAGSCAEEAGIEVGDIIVALGEVQITSREDLKAALKEYKAGDTVTVKLYRSGREITVELVLDEKAPTTAEPAPATNDYGSRTQEQDFPFAS